jgi:UDP-GlcNAc3NAcA epimerase
MNAPVLLTVIGARPQFVKAATVSRAVAARGDLREVIVHTGQHYDANMSDVFFDELDIPRPDFQLGIGGVGHGAMTGRQLEAIEKVLIDVKPDWVLVYGDTNSTLAGALAAAKLHIPVAHVEAGLRSFERRMPEEINRILTDHASSLLFAPTEAAVRNLAAEGIAGNKVRLVGDVMYDAALFYRSRARRPEWFDQLGVAAGEFALCTIHRAENVDDDARLRRILDGLAESGLPVVLPLHPRTRAKLESEGVAPAMNIRVVPPVGYLEMTWLEMNCRVVATDSGGVQKEAYFHGKPCVTFRDQTEWIELVETGWNRLCPPAADGCIASALQGAAIEGGAEVELYGRGDAAERLIESLVSGMTHGRLPREVAP